MKPIFTIHAGEYLVGDYLEKRFSDCEIWVPSKDTGTDLLITNSKKRSNNVGVQVKFSKDFLPGMEATFISSLSACGWWTLKQKKIQDSNADLWIIAPYSFVERKIHFIIIEPSKLFDRLTAIHGNQPNVNIYFWVTNDGKCFETRSIGKVLQKEISNGNYQNIEGTIRDFTEYLDAWEKIEDRLY